MSAALLAQLYAIRAQVDAAIIAVQGHEGAPAPPVDPETCPNCGATADAQVDRSTLDGTKRRFCKRCQVERVI